MHILDGRTVENKGKLILSYISTKIIEFDNTNTIISTDDVIASKGLIVYSFIHYIRKNDCDSNIDEIIIVIIII